MNKIEIVYLCISVLLPLIYLISYARYKTRKKKHYGKAFLIALIMFLILIAVGFSIKLVLNNKNSNNNQKETTTTTLTTTTTTTETTTTQIVTTTKKATPNYNALSVPANATKLGTTSKGFDVMYADGLYYVGGYLVANKTYDLSKDYNPGKLNATVQSAANEMFAQAKAEGYSMYNASGFRSYDTQAKIYNRYVSRDGQTEADTYSARPGYSEHQSGLAFDICASDSSVSCIDSGFDNTKYAKWLDENAYKYGFIKRYPKGKESETGYMFESWHYRYVGTELAEKLYNNGNWISVEDYLGITSSYDSKPIGR